MSRVELNSTSIEPKKFLLFGKFILDKSSCRFIANAFAVSIISILRNSTFPFESRNEITSETIKHFHVDCNKLKNISPDFEPKATDHIKEMVELIDTLIEKD